MNKRPLLISFAFITLCLLPVMILRDFTPDNELRYLQIADEAIENGNVFAFTLQGEAYADKPPLYLWIVILGKLLFGKHSMLFLSLFSLVPAFVTISVMDRWTALRKPADRVGVVFMMMTCALFLGASVFLRMDMLMTMFIVLALYSFWQMYEGTFRKHSVLLPVWIFLALFTKGPVGLLMPPLAIVCFLLVKRKGRDIGKYLGWKTWGIIASLCLVWFTGVYLDGGKDYLNNLLFHQTMGRAVNSFHHKAPFWYYFAAVWYIVAPYMFLLAGAVTVSFRKGDGEFRSDRETFFLVTIVSVFVMLSSFSAKLAIYLAPIMPFMVLLFVEVLKRTGWKKWMTWSLAVPLCLVAVLALAALSFLLFGASDSRLAGILAPYSFIRSGMVKVSLILLVAGFSAALFHLVKGRPNISLVLAGTSMLLAVYAASSQLPRMNDWIGYRNLCGTIPGEGRVTTLYIRRPQPMKVFLGKEIIDYKKDFNAFYESEIQGREEGEPLVLITRSAKAGTDASLGAFVQENNHWSVGPYCVVAVKPDGEGKNLETL